MKTIFILTSQYHICSDKSIGSYHSLISGLKLNNCKIKTTGTCSLLDFNDEIITEENIIKTGKSSDLIILFYVNIPKTTSCEDILNEPYLSKAFEINRWEKTIFIDYYEHNWRNTYDLNQPIYHKVLIKNCKNYFKREFYPWLLKWFKNIHPFPLSYFPPNPIPFPEKKFDIFCSFPQKKTGLREKVIQLCKHLQGEFNIIIKDNCTQDEYINYIRQSWITLDSKGAGYINNRFLEIISNRSFCIREKYDIIFHKDYDCKNMIMEYKNIKELEYILKTLLNNKDLIINMEKKAYENYNLYHTSDKVIKYLLNLSL